MTLESPRFIGVDGAPDGWVAVGYDAGFAGVARYPDAETLWENNSEAETILVDVPIGMREDSGEPRACDAAARECLSPVRHSSVFPVPIRDAAHEESYEDAKDEQEAKTAGSLGVQSHAIADKIRELDDLLHGHPDAVGNVRESHPEVCFAALGDDPMQFSKTGQPAAAFWERVGTLETVDEETLAHLRAAGESVTGWDDPACSNDDLLDAFVLAVTASDLTGELRTLPEEPEEDERGLPMEIVYADP